MKLSTSEIGVSPLSPAPVPREGDMCSPGQSTKVSRISKISKSGRSFRFHPPRQVALNETVLNAILDPSAVLSALPPRGAETREAWCRFGAGDPAS